MKVEKKTSQDRFYREDQIEWAGLERIFKRIYIEVELVEVPVDTKKDISYKVDKRDFEIRKLRIKNTLTTLIQRSEYSVV